MNTIVSMANKHRDKDFYSHYNTTSNFHNYGSIHSARSLHDGLNRSRLNPPP